MNSSLGGEYAGDREKERQGRWGESRREVEEEGEEKKEEEEELIQFVNHLAEGPPP